MKLFDIIVKEISLVKSQKIALLLIFLYPFLAISLLGLSFSGISLNQLSLVNIGVVNDLAFDSDILDNLTENRQNFNLIYYDDIEALKNGVKHKEITLGLRLMGLNENSVINVEMYYDNSNLLASGIFREFAKVAVQQVAIEKTQSTLGLIWKTISDLSSNLKSQENQIIEFKEKLDSAEINLNSLESKLNQLDIEKIEEKLDSQKSDIDTFEAKNDAFMKELNSFKQSFTKLKNDLDSFSEDIETYQDDLELIQNQMDVQILFLGGVISQLNETGQTEIATELAKTKTRIEEWNLKLKQSNDLLNEVSNENSNINKNINEVDNLLIRLENESKAVSSALNSSNQTINTMNSELLVFKESLDEVKDLISEARKSKVEIESKLDSSLELFSSFAKEFEAFNKVDPKVLAQPVIFFEKKIFEVDSFGIIVANAVAIVLILTCMLLTSIIIILERIENVSLRLALAPTNKGLLLLGKIIGQLIIALCEAIIIFFVASAVFNIDLLHIMPQLILATIIIATSFISLGVLVAAFTKNQSTAMLISLLMVVPMLFLSGVILPLEFMDPLMGQISSFLPLTAANNLLIGIIVKNIELQFMFKEIIILLAFILIAVIVYLMRKESF